MHQADGGCSNYYSVIQDGCSSTSAILLHCHQLTIAEITAMVAAAGGAGIYLQE